LYVCYNYKKVVFITSKSRFYNVKKSIFEHQKWHFCALFWPFRIIKKTARKRQKMRFFALRGAGCRSEKTRPVESLSIWGIRTKNSLKKWSIGSGVPGGGPFWAVFWRFGAVFLPFQKGKKCRFLSYKKSIFWRSKVDFLTL
jgi:hypothetical protein